MRASVLVVLSVLMAWPLPALAQPPSPQSSSDLPVSLARIKRGLRESEARGDGQGLKLTYYVNVLGESPRIDLFKNFNATTGSAPGASVSHKELFAHFTPQEFSSPPADVLGAVAWLGATVGGRLVKKIRDSQRP
jgi:hypothetical protein